jgi:hypothetical protein
MNERSRILAEFERRKRMGAFDQVVSLRNKYADAGDVDVDDQMLRDLLNQAGREWEEDIDPNK